MITCEWAIICQQSIINEETGNISLIEVIEALDIPPLPKSEGLVFFPLSFNLVIGWSKNNDNQEDEQRFRLSIVDPLGTVLLQGEQIIDSNFDDRMSYFSVLKFNGIPIYQPGLYEFRIEIPVNDETEWQNVKVVYLAINYEQLEDESNIQIVTAN